MAKNQFLETISEICRGIKETSEWLERLERKFSFFNPESEVATQFKRYASQLSRLRDLLEYTAMSEAATQLNRDAPTPPQELINVVVALNRVKNEMGIIIERLYETITKTK